MSDSVLYRGDSPETLTEALLAVIMYARDSEDDFKFGPLKLSALNRDGLRVEGDDLSGVKDVLSGISGLAIVEH